jgi:hypothetical protein
MDLYKQKYLKYKSKYLNLKFQLGGDFAIEFDEIINSHPILSKIKEAFYSYCYLYRTSLEKKEHKVCPKEYPNINCILLEKITFLISGCNEEELCKVKILKDNKFNNIIVCFEHGSVLFCPYLSDKLFSNLIKIYDLLQKYSDYNKIIFVGHSMGASIVIMLSYIIMLIEKKITPEKDTFIYKYFDYYTGASIPNINIPSFVKDESKRLKLLQTQTEEQEFLLKQQFNYKMQEICKIKKIIETSIKKYNKLLHNNIEICIGGGFPVLFRNSDFSEFEEFTKFYDNRYIHFINVQYDERGEIKGYDPVMLNTWKDGTIFGNIQLSNHIVYNIMTLSEINLNLLDKKHTISPDNLLELNFYPFDKHFYGEYVNILKNYIKIKILD